MNKIHTRENIKDSTKNLLWKKGIKKTSVIDICNSANISRMTFYREFENKNEIVSEIISEFTKEWIEIQLTIFNKPIPFIEKLNELIYSKMELINGISRELLIDLLKQENLEYKLLMERQKQIRLDFIQYHIETEQKKGNIRKGLNSELIMFYIDNITELLFNPKLEQLYPAPSKLILELNKFFYFGVLERN